jgi:hypothetical protein
MSGAPATQKVYLDEYAVFGGFTLPSRLRLVFDDEEFGKGRTEVFTANAKVDAALFVKK